MSRASLHDKLTWIWESETKSRFNESLEAWGIRHVTKHRQKHPISPINKAITSTTKRNLNLWTQHLRQSLVPIWNKFWKKKDTSTKNISNILWGRSVQNSKRYIFSDKAKSAIFQTTSVIPFNTGCPNRWMIMRRAWLHRIFYRKFVFIFKSYGDLPASKSFQGC